MAKEEVVYVTSIIITALPPSCSFTQFLPKLVSFEFLVDGEKEQLICMLTQISSNDTYYRSTNPVDSGTNDENKMS